ncbi:hypothetical protein LG198_13200 [Methylobacillus arboreus]|uniref:hypothetical protein n=1 Tax=Methylobacillus arboreus TaxID=755170 RepID=UPI001E3B7306|nr:hypothetical protein [Methylobacillus arboreus]MCB5191689.1 hypothetical protein [Methylobacillus arboreus]
MAKITINKLDASIFEVAVEATSFTSHRVTVAPEYVDKLSQGRFDSEELVRRSFEFLLEREPNTSILRSFDLSVISRYFPEYERKISS